MRSSVASIVSTAQERINVCMNALKEVSKVWLVAKMVQTLFEVSDPYIENIKRRLC